MAGQTLKLRFHSSDAAEETARHLLRLFLQANGEKLNDVIRAAASADAGLPEEKDT